MRRSLTVLLVGALATFVAPPVSSLSTPPDGDAAITAASPAPACGILAYPPYDPAFNYCGPEWLQEEGWGFLVPREPVTGYDFSPACYGHDACYTECCENGLSQADCDARFLADLRAICDTTGAELMRSECPLGLARCRHEVQQSIDNCKAMAEVYEAAVSYIGDGNVELDVFWTLLFGSWAGMLMTALVPNLQVEAAYPCPCACLQCPADEPTGFPVCIDLAPPFPSMLEQTVIRYEKQGWNVSGVGPVCSCVGTPTTVWDPCPPPGGCSPSHRVCAADYCYPEQCERIEPVGPPTCQPAFRGWVMKQLYEEWYCQRADRGSVCVSKRWSEVLSACPGGCTIDGLACAMDCDPTVCVGTAPGATTCAYDYRRYRIDETVGVYGCRPDGDGGTECAVVAEEQRPGAVCPWGCTGDGTACAQDGGAPEAPGHFLVVQSPGQTEFSWSDHSLDEHGFRIYHGACAAPTGHPCTLLATVPPDQGGTVLEWQRPELSDTCWEVRAFNAVGESAPAFYCLP